MSEIRNNPGQSSYFQGKFQGYGRYQWNIKFNGFQDDSEMEIAQLWALGDYNYSKGSFELLNDLLGRSIKASTQGRSGGWLVIDSVLTPKELKKVDKYVKECLKSLPAFLKSERDFHASEALAAEKAEKRLNKKLSANPKVKQALKLIKSVAGVDAVVVIKGISFDLETGLPAIKESA